MLENVREFEYKGEVFPLNGRNLLDFLKETSFIDCYNDYYVLVDEDKATILKNDTDTDSFLCDLKSLDKYVFFMIDGELNLLAPQKYFSFSEVEKLIKLGFDMTKTYNEEESEVALARLKELEEERKSVVQTKVMNAFNVETESELVEVLRFISDCIMRNRI